MSLQAVNDSDFDTEVLGAAGPVLVDFWAEWCGPCKSLMPVIEEISGEMAGRVKVVKMNIEDAPDTPSKYGLRGVPTLMLFRDGQVLDTRVGGMPKAQLTDWLSEHV